MPLISIFRVMASLVRAAHLTIEQVYLEFSGSYDRCDLLVFTCLFTCMATDRGPQKLRCRAGVISWHLASFMFIEWSKHHIYWHVSGHSLPDTLPSSHWHTFIFWGSSIFWPPLMDVNCWPCKFRANNVLSKLFLPSDKENPILLI